ncbi:rRNA pseudouridine synthase [Hazenella sp. IB182357]|uniref:Pseudouridine synthase n=1 Tax=Polycladospora coralii TaxID=2771432 RepID=A0A926RV76_9BACL|nr:rRNA pseudouridine synthase [Polycladospora coralii]MBS7528888.1 rRNA pseudouridine synthase [Polycladospora coralii]
MRLDKMLANMGIGTRKEIRQLAKAGRITVNDQIIKDVSKHIHLEKDLVELDGHFIQYRAFIYLMMNKPAGVLSATTDRYDEVVIDLLEDTHLHFEPFPVGRLDKDTEGLLLLTNDGKLSHQLLAPKKHVPKTYYAQISGKVTSEDQDKFKRGVTLDDGYLTKPAQLKILHTRDHTSEIELTLTEGKFHQVKRMFEALGKKVTYLKRISMGELILDPELDLGEYRELTADEVALLQKTYEPNL